MDTKMKKSYGFKPVGSAQQDNPAQNLSSLDPRLSRTNYFDGRLLKASDLTRDQSYLDERLREVGRAMGSGIVRGLEIDLSDKDELSVNPGMAVSPSGRILELSGPPLMINLHDSAVIHSLNPDGFTRFPRGIYALTLQFLEVGEDSAEVYPRDLEGQRGYHFNAWSEGVEVSLTPLRNSLPSASEKTAVANRFSQHALAARSSLVREFIINPGQPIDLAEDAVALALIAIEHGRPLWIDQGLVRRPQRHPHSEHVLQQDLHRHYQELLADVTQQRIERGVLGEFPASHYFRLLPPYGNIPKETLNPENGRQAYFPAGYEVSIAPVRQDDLPTLLAESSALDPIDLEQHGDIDIMVLVPMSDHQFAWRARQLQHREEPTPLNEHTALPHLDRLALRLYNTVPENTDPTDQAIWRAIWAEAGQAVFVRRPPRVAETLVSGVMLAAGYKIPTGLSTLPADAEKFELERDRLEETVAARDRAIQRNQQEIKKLRNQLDQNIDERLANAQAAVSKLSDELEKATVDNDELILLRKQHNLQLAEITRLKLEIDALGTGTDESDAGRQALLDEIDALNTRLADADSQIEQLKKQLKETDKTPKLKSVSQLIKKRGGNASIQTAGKKLAEIIGSDQTRLGAVHGIAQLIDRRYDSLLFTTLSQVAQKKNLTKLDDTLSESIDKGTIGELMNDILPQFGLSQAAARQWLEFEQSMPAATADTEHRERIKSLQNQVNDLSEKLRIASESTDTDASPAERAELKQALEAANADIAILKRTADTDARTSATKIEKLTNDLKTAKSEITTLKRNQTAIKKESRLEIAKLTRELKAANTKIATLNRTRRNP